MTEPMSKKILVVEDEKEIARLVQIHLQDQGHEVSLAATAEEGRSRIAAGGHDLVVLDLMLPDGDGMELCRELRARTDYTPVLILTARSGEVDRVLGLELGADDYLTKPFSVRELVARVKAIFRRVELAGKQDAGAQPVLRADGLEIDREKRRVVAHGEEVKLTAKEFDLLVQFAANPGRVYTRSELLDLVWGYGVGCYEHTVNSHINRLRSKIEEDPSDPRLIQTVWGVGYRFRDPSRES
jgi:DNA-binding response OmpR family regulator